jgi:hypothetical protein
VLAAMKAGRGYITESPGGPHLEITLNDQPMGSAVQRPVTAEAVVRGAGGDTLAWIDAGGVFAEREIESDDWRCDLGLLESPALFVRAEIIARASRDRLVRSFTAEFPDGALPWELTAHDLATQPIRRAISNPVYVT